MSWLKRQTENFTAWKTHFLYGVYFLWIIPAIKYLITKEIDIESMFWITIAFEVGQNGLTSWKNVKEWAKTRLLDSIADCAVAIIGGVTSLTFAGIVYAFAKFLGV